MLRVVRERFYPFTAFAKTECVESVLLPRSMVRSKLFVLCISNFEPPGSRKLPKPVRVEKEGKENVGC